MLMAYLPAERMVFEAALVDTHVPLPAVASPAHRSFHNEIRTLGLEVSQIVPIHGQPIPWSAFINVIGS